MPAPSSPRVGQLWRVRVTPDATGVIRSTTGGGAVFPAQRGVIVMLTGRLEAALTSTIEPFLAAVASVALTSYPCGEVSGLTKTWVGALTVQLGRERKVKRAGAG